MAKTRDIIFTLKIQSLSLYLLKVLHHESIDDLITPQVSNEIFLLSIIACVQI